MTDAIPSAGSDHQRDVVLLLQQSALQLSGALAEGSAAKTSALLELISRLAASSSSAGLPGDAAAQVCASCTVALGDPSPEVAARAGLALGTTLQLCQTCSGGQDFSQQLDLVSVAQQAVAAMQRHTAEPAVTASGLHLLLRLAGCAGCRTHVNREQQDLLGAAGAVPAAVAALAALTSALAAAAACPSQDSSASSGGAGGGTPATPSAQQQQRVHAISEGLQALHYICVGHADNLGQLAASGSAGAHGMHVVVAAMQAAASEWPAEEHGLLLLAQLACRESAPLQEQQAAAVAIWQAAQAQVERRLVEVGRAAVWGMARVLQRLLLQAPAIQQQSLVPELLLQGTAVVLAMLQSCDKKDDPLMKHCCDFLSMAATAAANHPALAAALLSREAAAAVLVVAGQAQEAHTQASALRTLYHLCQAGGCGLTWQELATGEKPDPAKLAAGGASVAAAVFIVVGGAGQAVAAKDAAARPARDALAVQLYGVAAVGALVEAAQARCPAAAALLTEQLHREQLGAAQEAVAVACGMLGRSPELLALLEQEQEGGVSAGPASAPACEPTVLLDCTKPSCHLARWEEPLTWRPAADAVRGVLRLLGCAPEGANAPDREGFCLLHRLALAGHARCLELLLQLAPAQLEDASEAEDQAAGGLDLLVRTRTGATALQLARLHRHDACVELLEGATQRAAEARQDALLRELEEMEVEEGAGSGSGKKSKKKKAVSRSTSFAADQPDGKTQKLNLAACSSSSGGSDQDDEMVLPMGRLSLHALQQDAKAAQAEMRLQAQRERDEAYEQALEARRLELQEQQHAQLEAAAAAVAAAAATTAAGELVINGEAMRGPAEEEEEAVQGEHSRSSTDSRDQPGTPDQQDDQPATPNAQQAAAMAAESGGAAGCSSGGSSSPEPQLARQQLLGAAAAAVAAARQAAAPSVPDSQHGAASSSLLAGASGLRMQLQASGPNQLPSLTLLHQRQQQQAALDSMAANTGAVSSSSTSLFAEPAPATAGSSLFGSPAMASGLLDSASPHSHTLPGSSLPSSVGGSPFLRSLAGGSPTTSRPITGSSPFGCPSPPGSAAPFPSPANASLLAHPRHGLPPLPGGRQQSFGAAMAAASGGTTAAAAAAAAAAVDTDHLLSMHLQDALFVGSPAPSPGSKSLASHMQQDSPQQQRQSLFAALAPHGSASPGGDDDDADSIHLLSSSLSCLDDGGAGGEAPLVRHLSSNGSRSSGSGSGSMSAAADSLMASLRQQQQADWLSRDAALLPGTSAGSPGSGSGFSSPGSAHRAAAAAVAAADPNSDESLEPTRHLWIGNLGTRTPRAVLKTIFERFGIVDDVVTFPGRMYAFVNYRTTEEATSAFETLQDQQVAELTGERRLLIKYRPAKKAAIHLRALGLVDEDGSPTDDRLDLDRDGNSSEPSPRIWLGNIAPTATSKNLHAVLGRFGVLTDAAVFPARIGPLGYAFVKFERLEDATRAFEALNNTVVPPLSGSKQLKMRYKPANDGPVGRGEDPSDPGKAIMVPSRHLWLGNITQKPTDEQVLEVFAAFGKVDSVRVFPVKAYAFVNYADIGSAIKAMQAVDGLAIPQLTGVKPLVMRYQQESGGSTSSTPKPPGSAGSNPAAALLPRVASEAAMSAAFGLNQLVPGASLASLLAGAGAAGPASPSLVAAPTTVSGDGSGSDDGLMPVPNLSNKLNPNNIHYDAELAERYKHMNRREKDLMWAADSLLHPADPAKGMLRSQSMGYLHGPTSSSSAAAAAAATAQAHAAMAVLLQQQQQQQQHNGGAGGAPNGSSLLTSQLLALQQLAPSAAPAQPSQLPTGASASQLTAVLNNLTAMRRTGSLPSPGSLPAMHTVQSMPLPQQHHHVQHLHASQGLHALAQAQFMPAPGSQHAQQQAQQAEYQLQQLLLAQQAQQALTPLNSFGSTASTATSAAAAAAAAAASPSQQIHRLSSLLANQTLGGPGSGSSNGRASTPLLSLNGPGTPGGSAVLSPQPSTGLAGMAGAPATPGTHHAQSLAAALGQLAATQGGGHPHAPPSPGGLLPPQHPAHGHGHAQAAPQLGGGSLPHQFYCPLSRQIMADPVIAADGVTYERQAISEWLSFKDVSPATHMPLPHKVLTPNSVLRAGLIDLLRHHC